jgi:uncharacterized protein
MGDSLRAGESSRKRRRCCDMEPRRLRRLARTEVLGREVPVASGFRSRLLGLALLPRERAGAGLLIPRCSSVHTFGMRFPLDLVFLDREGSGVCEVRAVRPFRIVACPGAAAVLELPARACTGGQRGVMSSETEKGDRKK